MTIPKPYETLRARAALAGVELHTIRNDREQWTIYATVGPVTLELGDLQQAERWFDSIAAPAATEGERV